MSTARDTILRRLRATTVPDTGLPPVPATDQLFSDLPDSTATDVLCRTFQQRLEALHGEVWMVADEAEAAARLAQLTAVTGPVLAQSEPWLQEVIAQDPELAKRVDMLTRDDLASPEMAAYDVGITTADCVIARTGSIVMRASQGGGRRLSVLPPMHIVLARTGQVVPSLEQALGKLEAEDDDWSSAVLITGPSRTADIEKILVLGAHGPKRLVVILVDDHV